VIVAADWQITAFPWDDATDPRQHLQAWRDLASGDQALVAMVPAVDFKFGYRGPRQMKWSDEMTRRGPGPDHFGDISRTSLQLPKGKWRFTTLSDDGVRVIVNGQAIIEHWDHHGPQRDTAVFEQKSDDPIEILVEHFEIDGYSVLELQITPELK